MSARGSSGGGEDEAVSVAARDANDGHVCAPHQRLFGLQPEVLSEQLRDHAELGARRHLEFGLLEDGRIAGVPELYNHLAVLLRRRWHASAAGSRRGWQGEAPTGVVERDRQHDDGARAVQACNAV